MPPTKRARARVWTEHKVVSGEIILQYGIIVDELKDVNGNLQKLFSINFYWTASDSDLYKYKYG